MNQITNIRKAVCIMANELKKVGLFTFTGISKGLETCKTYYDSSCNGNYL